MPGDSAGQIDFLTSAPIIGSLPARWNHGNPPRSRRPRGIVEAAAESPIQIHPHDEHTYVLRQSKALSYEGPFLFLLFGNDRALLLDTGATADPTRFPLRETVDRLVDSWLEEHPRPSYELVVAHTHGHGDHVAADAQFGDRDRTSVVGIDVDAVTSFFGFARWPEEVVTYDLGGRVLDIMGSPGHHKAAISIYDPWTGWLLTGDSVYPGRLYVRDMPAFIASLKRLVDLAQDRDVRRVIGCHIEMTTTPGRDYPVGSKYQPDEPPLEMTVDQLRNVRRAAVSVADSPGAHTFDDFIIFNGPSFGAVAKHIGRSLWSKLRDRLPL